MKELSIKEMEQYVATDNTLSSFMTMLLILLFLIGIVMFFKMVSSFISKKRDEAIIDLILILGVVIIGLVMVNSNTLKYSIGESKEVHESHVLKAFSLKGNEVTNSTAKGSSFLIVGDYSSESNTETKPEYLVYQSDGKTADTGFVLTKYNATEEKVKVIEHEKEDLKEPYVLITFEETILKEGSKDYGFYKEQKQVEFHVPKDTIKSDEMFDLSKVNK